MARHNETGHWGEDIAADYLTGEGFAIVERNWHHHHYEIDLIGMRDDLIVVAEVKTRTNRDEDPLEAVDSKKILYMVRAAEAFLKETGLPHQVRFDLFAISGTPDDYTFEHIPDAFYPPLKTYN